LPSPTTPVAISAEPLAGLDLDDRDLRASLEAIKVEPRDDLGQRLALFVALNPGQNRQKLV